MINVLVNLIEKILPIAIGIIGVVSRNINTMLLSAITIILFYIFKYFSKGKNAQRFPRIKFWLKIKLNPTLPINSS